MSREGDRPLEGADAPAGAASPRPDTTPEPVPRRLIDSVTDPDPGPNPDADADETQIDEGRPRPKPRAKTRPGGSLLAGRYRIERPIAKGGMGRVYLATQLPLERLVAVKVLNPEFQKTDPRFVRRFCLEAAVSAKLSHPNVVIVHDYGEAPDGDLFMAMEYLDGLPLSRVISRDGPMPPDRLLHIAVQICRALREAHRHGVIHRDLKPGNIMLTESADDPDVVKVLDFGLVKLFEQEGDAARHAQLVTSPDGAQGDLTRAGTLLGSPRYMSPEQIRGRKLDPRTDIYSLGVILFQMATGRPPFSGSTSVEVIYKHLNHKVPSIEGDGVDCPPPVRTIIERCLRKKRRERYRSMREVVVALRDAQRVVTGASIGTDSLSISRSSWSVDSEPPSDGIPAETGDAAPRDRDGGRGNDHCKSRRAGRRRRAVLVAVAGVAAVAAGAFLVMALPLNPAPAIAPPADLRSRVSFVSTPRGADVVESGVVLGTTPFDRRFERSDLVRAFEFRLDGHVSVTATATFDRPSVDLHTRLRRPGPAAPREVEEAHRPQPRQTPPRAKPEPQPDDRRVRPRSNGARKRPRRYRDNPY